MTPRTLDLPADPERAEEAARLIVAALAAAPDGEQQEATERHIWAWACQVTGTAAEAERAYFAALTAAGLPPAPEQPDAAPNPEPQPELEPPAEQPDDGPEPAADDTPTPEPQAPAPLPPPVAERARRLAERLAHEPAQIAAPIPRYDPDEHPVIAGRVEAVEHVELRQRRGGAVRVILLRTHEDGLVEVWLGHQQSAALVRELEAERRSALAPGDLFAIAAKGKQRIGRSRNLSRTFSIAIERSADQ